MSAFSDDHAKDMNNPEYAYQFGRNEREAEIIKLLKNDYWHDLSMASAYLPQLPKQIHRPECIGCQAIALIKGEK